MKRLGSSCSTVSAADGCYVVAQCDQSATSPPDCPLGRTLEYRNDLQLAPGDLISILKLTPQLTDLVTTLPNTDIYDLVVNDAHLIVVPMLEHLVLHVNCRYIKDDFGDKMSELVSSRCEGRDEKTRPQCSLSIRLVFYYDLYLCFSTQELLDKVYRAPRVESKDYQLSSTPELTMHAIHCLRDFEVQIRRDFVEISRCITAAQTWKTSGRMFKSSQPGLESTSRRVMKTLNEVNAYNICDATAIYVSSSDQFIAYHI